MARSFEDGISSYIHAQAVADVYFPVDAKGNADISCSQCYFFRESAKAVWSELGDMPVPKQVCRGRLSPRPCGR